MNAPSPEPVALPTIADVEAAADLYRQAADSLQDVHF